MSPQHHPISQLASHTDMTYNRWTRSCFCSRAICGWVEWEKRGIAPCKAVPFLSFSSRWAFHPLRWMHVKAAKSARLGWSASKSFAPISSFPNLNQYFYVYTLLLGSFKGQVQGPQFAFRIAPSPRFKHPLAKVGKIYATVKCVGSFLIHLPQLPTRCCGIFEGDLVRLLCLSNIIFQT